MGFTLTTLQVLRELNILSLPYGWRGYDNFYLLTLVGSAELIRKFGNNCEHLCEIFDTPMDSFLGICCPSLLFSYPSHDFCFHNFILFMISFHAYIDFFLFKLVISHFVTSAFMCHLKV